MSYIRCLSNPEGLYIWGDTSGEIAISTKGDIKWATPEDFHGVFKAYDESWDGENLTFGELTLRERSDKKFRWSLSSTRGWEIILWQVTVDHVSENVAMHIQMDTRWWRIKSWFRYWFYNLHSRWKYR